MKSPFSNRGPGGFREQEGDLSIDGRKKSGAVQIGRKRLTIGLAPDPADADDKARVDPVTGLTREADNAFGGEARPVGSSGSSLEGGKMRPASSAGRDAPDFGALGAAAHSTVEKKNGSKRDIENEGPQASKLPFQDALKDLPESRALKPAPRPTPRPPSQAEVRRKASEQVVADMKNMLGEGAFEQAYRRDWAGHLPDDVQVGLNRAANSMLGAIADGSTQKALEAFKPIHEAALRTLGPKAVQKEPAKKADFYADETDYATELRKIWRLKREGKEDPLAEHRRNRIERFASGRPVPDPVDRPEFWTSLSAAREAENKAAPAGPPALKARHDGVAENQPSAGRPGNVDERSPRRGLGEATDGPSLQIAQGAGVGAGAAATVGEAAAVATESGSKAEPYPVAPVRERSGGDAEPPSTKPATSKAAPSVQGLAQRTSNESDLSDLPQDWFARGEGASIRHPADDEAALRERLIAEVRQAQQTLSAADALRSLDPGDAERRRRAVEALRRSLAHLALTTETPAEFDRLLAETGLDEERYGSAADAGLAYAAAANGLLGRKFEFGDGATAGVGEIAASLRRFAQGDEAAPIVDDLLDQIFLTASYAADYDVSSSPEERLRALERLGRAHGDSVFRLVREVADRWAFPSFDLGDFEKTQRAVAVRDLADALTAIGVHGLTPEGRDAFRRGSDLAGRRRSYEAVLPTLGGFGALGGLRLSSRPRITISAHPASGKPQMVFRGYAPLRGYQRKILERMPQPSAGADDYLEISKRALGPRDIAAFTAETGDEFAVFSLGGKWRIYRGTKTGFGGILNAKDFERLAAEGWRWSMHTHPVVDPQRPAGVLMASPGDRAVLRIFADHGRNRRSEIWNSVGQRDLFFPETKK